MTQRKQERGADYFARVVKPYRDRHIAKGLCLWCPKPVPMKLNGKPARLCVDHLAYERQRFVDRKARQMGQVAA